MLVAFVSVAGYPWAAWLLAKSGRDEGRWLTVLVGFAFSVGALSLLMLWEALLGIGLQLWAITVPYALLMLAGGIIWRRNRRNDSARETSGQRHWTRRVGFLIVAIISLAVLFNAAYWPFSRTDARRIYARYGRVMWIEGTLVSFATREDSYYQAYPVLVPLTITYSYLASGWKNEYLARMIPALLSLGCLPAAYVLGRMLHGELVGWMSMALLALTPAFGRWASSGYVDLPMAFFYTLSALFAWRLSKTRHWTDALLAGGMMGLAAWTKNAALLGVPILAVWLAWLWISRRIRLRYLALSLGACAIIAAPWYIRNLAEAGLIIPPTAWTDQARPDLESLLIFGQRPEIFGLPGWAIMIGGAAYLTRYRQATGVLLALWTAPFFVVWWLLLSYDPRFILMFLPPLCVVAGAGCASLWQALSPVWQKRLLAPIIVVGLMLAFEVAWNSVEGKTELLKNPLMGHDEKLAVIQEWS